MQMSFNGENPEVVKDVYIAPGACIIGKVSAGKRSSVWFNAVIRGDIEPVTIGEETNIQDNATVHTDEGYPTSIGNRVTVGHNAVLHGCTVEDEALIGMGAMILNGSRVEKGALVGAGALVPPGKVIPAGTLALGSPAKVARELSPGEYPVKDGEYMRYMQRAQRYMEEQERG